MPVCNMEAMEREGGQPPLNLDYASICEDCFY